MPRRWKWFTALGLVALVLDQVTKYWANNSLPTGPHGYGIAVPVIENFFDWRLSYNTGSAFSLFAGTAGARWFLTVIGIIALGAIVWMLVKAKDDQRRLAIGLGLVAGGAIGNLIDRILYGKVTDFVVWKWYEHEWPTFNVADAALCVGVGLLFLDMHKQAKEEKLAQKQAEASKSSGKGKGKAGKRKSLAASGRKS